MKKRMVVLGSIMVLMFVACSQGQVLWEGFNGSGIGGWNTQADSAISQVSSPVYEGTGAMKWIYTDSDQEWSNSIWNKSYTPMDLSLYTALTFEFAEDASNPSTDSGKNIYYDIYIKKDNGSIERSNGGNALGSIALSNSTSYREITINLNEVPNRSRVCGIAFWMYGGAFTDHAQHIWYIDALKLTPVPASEIVYDDFNRSDSNWDGAPDSEVSMSSASYEGTGALMWTYTDSDDAWNNMILKNNYPVMDLRPYNTLTFEIAEDAANPSTDVGHTLYYDLWKVDLKTWQRTRTNDTNALGNIALSNNTSYRKITIDLTEITDRSTICGISFWLDGTLFTDSSVHNWYIDDIRIAPDPDNVCSPIITPGETYFTKPTQIIMSCATAGVDIYYTLNGTIPTTASTKYSGPFTVSDKVVKIKAVAIRQQDGISSEVVSKEYSVLSAPVTSGNGVTNGNFNNGLYDWMGWCADINEYTFCSGNSWSSMSGDQTVTVVTDGGNSFARGTMNAASTWISFGLYQVVPVVRGANYTVTADWKSDTSLGDDAGWAEFIVYAANWNEINNISGILASNNSDFNQNSIIAKKDIWGVNDGDLSWDWEPITDSMSGGFAHAMGTNTFNATTDYVVVITKYYANSSGIQVAWDNISVALTTPLYTPGDANCDGKVNVSDLSLLAANYGTTSGATWGMGDFTRDGAVNVSDLSLLAANYGTGSTSTLSWADAYAQAFGTAGDADDNSSDEVSGDATSSACGSLGLSLIAGLMLMGLMLVKMEE